MITPVLVAIPRAFAASDGRRAGSGLEPAVRAEVPTVDQRDPVGWDILITTKGLLAPVTGRPILSLDGALPDRFGLQL